VRPEEVPRDVGEDLRRHRRHRRRLGAVASGGVGVGEPFGSRRDGMVSWRFGEMVL
jgi:hypothetical protein